MKNFGPFQLYTVKPNDIKYGELYTLEVELPILYSKKRIIRVYLPEDFNENKKYPVLFMADGQNIVDKFTSAFGAWDIDIHQHILISQGFHSFIVVGIDSPKDPVHRALEYSFPNIPIEVDNTGEFNKDGLDFESHLLYRYIALKLLPMLKQYFPISDNLEDIGAGGSSMGGIFALSLVASYPEVFGFGLVFSPGFFLYSKEKVMSFLDEVVPKLTNHRFYFYCGNVGFESKFLDRTYSVYRYIKKCGFNENNIEMNIDVTCGHNEASWSKHFEDAIKFCFK